MDKKGSIMKGYLFGLGAMIVGSVVFWFLVFGFWFLVFGFWFFYTTKKRVTKKLVLLVALGNRRK